MSRHGRIIDRSHPDLGARVTGTILVMPGGRGSSSSSSVLAEAIRRGTGPPASCSAPRSDPDDRGAGRRVALRNPLPHRRRCDRGDRDGRYDGGLPARRRHPCQPSHRNKSRDASVAARLQEQALADQLALKDRALDVAAEGITIADARLPARPLIYANEGFERLTGYPVAEVLGRNCRFLQGPGSDPAAVAEIRAAIAAERECIVEILNYRRDGSSFWNRLSITPVRDDGGAVTHYIGIQSDVTARREAEDGLRRAKEALDHDLRLAARVQQALLPPASLRSAGCASREPCVPAPIWPAMPSESSRSLTATWGSTCSM
jgi:PAS domain S-box-containing protein